jgi:hypothetical protein
MGKGDVGAHAQELQLALQEREDLFPFSSARGRVEYNLDFHRVLGGRDRGGKGAGESGRPILIPDFIGRIPSSAEGGLSFGPFMGGLPARAGRRLLSGFPGVEILLGPKDHMVKEAPNNHEDEFNKFFFEVGSHKIQGNRPPWEFILFSRCPAAAAG